MTLRGALQTRRPWLDPERAQGRHKGRERPMYLPRSFEETDRTALLRFMQSQPLATLVTMADDGPCADHLPLLVSDEADRFVLRGHVARANPAWRQIDAHPDVLAIFHDPGAYISPSWYPTKAQTHRVVPTWNYTAVHARGHARTHHGTEWLHALLTQITDAFESARPAPWKLSDAPADYVQSQMKSIVGIEIDVTSIVGKWKMSQNRLPGDIDGVITGLRGAEDSASAAMANEVERRRPR